jgi:hypothetical protein
VLKLRTRRGGASSDACAWRLSLIKYLYRGDYGLEEICKDDLESLNQRCWPFKRRSGHLLVEVYAVCGSLSLALKQRIHRKPTRNTPRAFSLDAHCRLQLRTASAPLLLTRSSSKLARSSSTSGLPATSSGEAFGEPLSGKAPGLP